MRAHSATHLLDEALREVLGDHAHQAGSLVEPDRLRYDFTHFAAVTPEELREITRRVDDMILDGMDVDIREMPIEDAKKLGAVALFGEKYGDVVRVVDMGGRSIEFCGGTHLDNTAKVGPFRIVSESSVASGVRRIEAVTGKVYLDQADETNHRLLAAADTLKTTPSELLHKLESNMKEMKDLRQTMEKMKDKLFAGEVDRFLFSAKNVSGLKVVTASRGNMDAADLRKMGDFLRDREDSIVAVMSAVNGEKISLLAVCGKNAVARGVRAGDIIREIAPIVGGKGGGKPDSAMGGGTDVLKIDDALAAVDDFVASHAKS
jgi:alanyl-tRNA synthetase